MVLSKRKLASIGLILMIPLYFLTVVSLPQNVSTDCNQLNASERRGFTDAVGFCTKIGYSHIRPYSYGFFTLNLPVSKFGVNIHGLNKYVAPFLLTAAALIWTRPVWKRRII